ncbi:histidine kinase [Hymenobacter sp. B81]|uniref:sensor histidine kinase n=1 Tax=Hymenobacter sp. B81 TaxID=3344878 RepID=UPI0037DCD22C
MSCPRRVLVLIAWLLAGLLGAQAAPGALQDLTAWQIRPGDAATWATAPLDAAWQPRRFNSHAWPGVAVPAPVYWLRTTATVPATARATGPQSLVLWGLHSAAEVYWDGQLIGRNGRVGATAAQERAGTWKYTVALPAALARPGPHTLALRVSDWQFAARPLQPKITLGGTEQLTRQDFRFTAGTLCIIGALVTAVVFCLVLYFGSARRISYLYLALYCASHAVKVAFKPLYFFGDVTFARHYLYSGVVHGAVVAGGIFLMLFLLSEFRVPRARLLMGLYVAFAAVAYWALAEGRFLVPTTVAALAVALYAVWRRQEGSALALAGVLGFAGFTYLGYQNLLNLGYFLGILFFIVCTTLSIGRQLARQQRLRQEALLRSARLENQLLRKNIQPHFLFNTLTSLQELIDQRPAQASQLIDALADEFRMISSIAEEKLIPIDDELKICQTHLRIMGFRREAEFALETRGLTGQERVPPATFHTLIENGLTHGYGCRGRGRFVLTKEALDGGVRYELFNDGDVPAPAGPVVEGTGSRYVKARLEESFPGCWRMHSAPVADGWRVVIDIFDRKRPALATR